MPTTANGNEFDGHLSKARGDNLELTLKPNQQGTVVRLLAYRNLARMGVYAEAIANGAALFYADILPRMNGSDEQNMVLDSM